MSEWISVEDRSPEDPLTSALTEKGGKGMPEYIDRRVAQAYLTAKFKLGEANLLDEVPAADVTPIVRAKWIGEEVCETGHTMKECSNCHRIRVIDNYCSHCGAKMEVEEDAQ